MCDVISFFLPVNVNMIPYSFVGFFVISNRNYNLKKHSNDPKKHCKDLESGGDGYSIVTLTFHSTDVLNGQNSEGQEVLVMVRAGCKSK